MVLSGQRVHGEPIVGGAPGPPYPLAGAGTPGGGTHKRFAVTGPAAFAIYEIRSSLLS